MLKYLTKKPSDGGNQSNNSNNAPAKPRYRGPDPQKNRFEYFLIFNYKYIYAYV